MLGRCQKCPRNLADECASYLVLGLEGPSASTEEIKKAYRAPVATFQATFVEQIS